jgi:DNA (cytosine-5)-methyltransferase 1
MTQSLKVLDLFSGCAGFSYAASLLGAAIETIQFVEIDPQAQATIQQNYPNIPIHDDITTFTAQLGQYDIITAGFPCQDISAANPKGLGLDGKQSGLFFEIVRIIRQCRPSYVLLENVAALLSSNRGRDMGTVLWELSQSGYDAEWEVIPAIAVGANHIRERLWITAYSNSNGRQGSVCHQRIQDKYRDDSPLSEKREGISRTTKPSVVFCFPPRLGEISTVPRMDDGISPGMDKCRLRS